MEASQTVLHALVIDDQPISRRVLELMLEKLGYTVRLCESGRQGVEAVRHGQFAVIFIDVNMPGTNGFATTRMIREIQSNTMRSTIVLTSAEYVNVDQDRSISAGADSFMEKPVQLDSLRSLVNTFQCQTKRPRKPTSRTPAVPAD